MDVKNAVTTISAILLLLLIPGAFVGAYFSLRKFIKNEVAMVLLVMLLGAVYFVAGFCAIVAGCSSIAPPNFK